MNPLWERELGLLADLTERSGPPTPEELTALESFPGWADPELRSGRFDWRGQPRGALARITPEGNRRWFSLAPLPVSRDLAELLWEEAGRRVDLRDARALDPCPGPATVCRAAPAKLNGLVLTEADPVHLAALRVLAPSFSTIVESPVWEAPVPDESFDVVVGSSPATFGRSPEDDKALPRIVKTAGSMAWYVARSVKALRPGGVAVVVVSASFLDDPADGARRWVSARADLVSAARLHLGEWAERDVLVFRRRVPGRRGDPAWVDSTMGRSAYYSSHPVGLTPLTEGFPVSSGTNEALSLVREALSEGREGALAAEGLPESFETRSGSPAEALALDLARAMRKALSDQTSGLDPEPSLLRVRTRLASLRKLVGPLAGAEVKGGKHPLARLVGSSEWPLIRSCEDSAGQPTDRVRVPCVRGSGVVPEDPKGALLASLDRLGRPDPDFVLRATNATRPEVEKALSGAVFPDPRGSGWLTASEYLSGDLPSRLREVSALAVRDPRHREGEAALKAAMPEGPPASELSIPLGAAWVPPAVVLKFCAHLMNRSEWGLEVRRVEETSTWTVACSVASVLRSADNVSTWGIPEIGALEILEKGLNLQSPVVWIEGDEGKRERDDEATQAAVAKLELIREEWDRWILDDSDRANALREAFADKFARILPRKFDGSHLSLPGLAVKVDGKTFEPRGSQLAAVERISTRSFPDDSAVVTHRVGLGKTFIGIAGAVRRWQLGLSDRVIFVVPSGRVFSQWKERFGAYYPGLVDKLLVAPEDPDEFSGFLSVFASGGYPFALTTYEQAGSVPLSPDAFASRIMAPVEVLEEALASATGDDKRVLSRALSSRKKAAEKASERHAKRWAKLSAGGVTPTSWERFAGPPDRCALIFDEWQRLKRIPISTRMERVSGLPTAESLRATDFLAKASIVSEGGGKIVGLTATPITNTLAETYVASIWFQPRRTKSLGLTTFDAWASVFTEPVTSVEMDATGRYRPVTRLRYRNLPELVNILGEVWDFAGKETGAKRPDVVGGEPRVVEVTGSDELAEYVMRLADRAEAIRGGGVDPKVDNLLKVTSDGRLAAMFNGPPSETFPGTRRTKLDALADEVWALYSRHHAERGTQLIFCDVGTPKGEPDADATPEERFLSEGIYGELKRRLVERGILRDQVAFIHDAKNEAQMDALFDSFNEGRIRVLIGSTDKLGVGTNPQKRVVAVHHLDCPWRPDQLVQRTGRGRRPGNLWSAIHVLVYVTTRSYDVCLWQLVQIKADFVSRIQEGEVSARTADDVGDLVVTAALAKAVALGDERVLRKVKIEGSLAHLARQKAAWEASRKRASRELEDIPPRIERLLAEKNAVVRASEALRERPAEFSVQLRDSKSPDFRVVRNPAEADSRVFALAAILRSALRKPARVGEYRGVTLNLEIRYGAPCLVADLKGAEVVILNVRSTGTFSELNRELSLLDVRAAALGKALEQEESRRRTLQAEAGRLWPKSEEASKIKDAYDVLCSEVADGEDGLVDKREFRL